ncbi:MAG TPA: helix-turn-helix domain-containing protein [Anaerolineales bacterium]|nr:helix-turn-helix domain-containing protein [Anaerolineales bacterium]
MEKQPFITTEEAAERLELTTRQVLRLIQTGDLPGARKLSNKHTAPYIIPTDSVNALVAQRKEAKQKRARGKMPRAR